MIPSVACGQHLAASEHHVLLATLGLGAKPRRMMLWSCTISVRVSALLPGSGRIMDLLEVKSRIAEALVEAIFRRARYQIRPFRNNTSPLRFGREDFSPDFRVSSEAESENTGEFLVEVKYRPSAYQFVSVENQRGERSIFYMARRQWPNLYFILVTDRPEAGRSGFQAIAFASMRPGEAFRTVDLVELKELRIFQHNIEDHEELIPRIFAPLNGRAPRTAGSARPDP